MNCISWVLKFLVFIPRQTRNIAVLRHCFNYSFTQCSIAVFPVTAAHYGPLRTVDRRDRDRNRINETKSPEKSNNIHNLIQFYYATGCSVHRMDNAS